MCLIFKQAVLDNVKSLPETFTAYKVYHKLRGTLFSPHQRTSKHGEITRPGVYEASENAPRSCEAFREAMDILRVELPHAIAIPVPAYGEGYALNVPGFHVIASKEDAELYRDDIIRQFTVQHERLSQGQKDILRDAEYVVVPVLVNKEDVYTAGITPFGGQEYTIHAINPTHKIPTYVTRKITLTDEAMTNATGTIWENGQWAGFTNDSLQYDWKENVPV